LPICRLTLKARIPCPGCPTAPRTLGEHLRKARLDRGLRQKDVAREIGCDPGTLVSWEKGRAEPVAPFLPRLLTFIGHDPRLAPAAIGGRIRAAREAEGISLRELACQLGLKPCTLAAWETGALTRPRAHIRAV